MGSLVVLALLLVFVPSANPMAHFLGVDPYETDLLSQYGPPSAAHPLGTDDARAGRTGAADAGRADFAARRRAGDAGRQRHRARPSA